MLKTAILGGALAAVFVPSAYAVSSGDIAFTGFNADRSSVSFVVLSALNPADTILFSSANESNGVFASNPAVYSWTAASALSVGTVVELTNFGKSNDTASTGTLARLPGGSFTSINTSQDTIYAFTGTKTSPSFVAGISNDKLSSNVFAGTGLTGSAAIQLSTGSAISGAQYSADYAKFNGSHTGYASVAELRAALAERSNWTIDTNNGNYNSAAYASLGTTSFSIAAVPEPSHLALLLGGLMTLGVVTKRRK